MTPGLGRGPPFPPKATKGSIVAVASLENPSVPMVVGVCEIDVASLQQVRGAKGRAIRGEHWDGDEIWAWNHGGVSGGAQAPDEIEGWDKATGAGAFADRLNDVAVEDSDDAQNEGGVPIPLTAAHTSSEKAKNNHVEGEDAEPFEKVDVEEKELSTKGTSSIPPLRQSLATVAN